MADNPDQTLQDIRKVNMKVDTFIEKVHHNIQTTNEEIKRLKKAVIEKDQNNSKNNGK